MTSVVRHLRAILERQARAFFAEQDTRIFNEGSEDGRGGIWRFDWENGADLPDYIRDDEVIWDEQYHARGGGVFYRCRPTGYMEDCI